MLAAYPYVRRQAAFTYDSGLKAPDPAALGKAAGSTGGPAKLAATMRAGWQLLGIREEVQPSKQEGSRQASSDGVEPPPAGSCAAALLAVFDDGAVRAARAAAAALKQEVMQHNVEAARKLLGKQLQLE